MSGELKFICQLAHGSSVAIIEKWYNILELYQQIAESFGIDKNDIMYLTINDFSLNMRNLFTGTLSFEDILYVHVRGRAVELELIKDSDSFGVTITENALGNAFIKDIYAGSVFHRAAPAIMIGQLIEKINGETVLGYRHYQVAKMLRNIKKDEKCTIRFISPKQATGPMGEVRKPEIGRQTVRFRLNGGFEVEDIQRRIFCAEICGRMNGILESYLGVQDDQLAMKIWDISFDCQSVSDLIELIRKSEMSIFNFPEELIFDIWGAVGDLRREDNSKSERILSTVKKTQRQSIMSIFQ